MNPQHSTRKELSRHATYEAAALWAIENNLVISTSATPSPYQIRRHPGYYTVIERVAIREQKKVA